MGFRVLMSQALGPYCDIKQDVTSWNYTEGASVALDMEEYERERDQCPMHFDDGTNPWTQSENYIKIFSYSYWSSTGSTVYSQCSNIVLYCALTIALFRYIH